MTIPQPPNDEMPPEMPDLEQPEPTPIDTPQDPEQRAPGEEHLPIGAPRDEPDPGF